jgi:hypothetical protein
MMRQTTFDFLTLFLVSKIKAESVRRECQASDFFGIDWALQNSEIVAFWSAAMHATVFTSLFGKIEDAYIRVLFLVVIRMHYPLHLIGSPVE